MRSGIALSSVVMLAGAPFMQQQQTSGRIAPDLRASIDSFVEQRVVTDAFAGVVFVARNGVSVYQRAAGIANRETGAPMRLDTKLQIASVTKLFTQVAIRQLEQAGKLSLLDTVGKFLPDYPNPVVRSRVTIEQLLRHRSGVGSFWNERFLAHAADVRTVRDYLELFQKDSLLFEPGTSEAYSNGGYVMLGAIIERVSGQSYYDYLRDNVFKPAGMTNTKAQDRRVAPENAAVGYTTQPTEMAGGDRRLAGQGPRPGSAPPAAQGEQRPRRPNTGFQAGVSSPAGDHFTTAADLIAFSKVLLEHRLLDSARTAAVLGARYAAGQDFRAAGGGPGVNAEFSIFPTGEVMVVLATYDPPAATTIAQYIRALIAPAPAVR